VIYFVSTVLSATKTFFLLILEIVADPKLKQHPEMLNLSVVLPSQSESVYPCSLTSSLEADHIQLYHAGTSIHSLLQPNGIVLASTKYWLRVLSAKQIFVLVLSRYIKDPIRCLYIVGSTKFESEAESLNFFRFVSIDVAMGF
jgi:hypothetical protein